MQTQLLLREVADPVGNPVAGPHGGSTPAHGGQGIWAVKSQASQVPSHGPCQASLRGTLRGSCRTCDNSKTTVDKPWCVAASKARGRWLRQWLALVVSRNRVAAPMASSCSLRFNAARFLFLLSSLFPLARDLVLDALSLSLSLSLCPSCWLLCSAPSSPWTHTCGGPRATKAGPRSTGPGRRVTPT